MREVRVRIIRSPENPERAKILLSEGLAMPSLSAVLARMRPKQRAEATKGSDVGASARNLSDAVSMSLRTGAVAPQVWADAIGQVLMETSQIDQPGGVAFSIQDDPRMAEIFSSGLPATLLVGTLAYRLTPVEMQDQTNMASFIKKRATEAAAEDGKRITDAAAAEAEMTIRQAERHRRRALRESALNSAEKRRALPQWVLAAERAVKAQEGNDFPFLVEMRIQFNPRLIQLGKAGCTLEWDTEEADRFSVSAWLPIDFVGGKYSLKGAGVWEELLELPHASHGQLCVNPEGLPASIESLEDLESVEGAVDRAYKVINLGSLLTEWEDWDKKVTDFFPPDLFEKIKTSGATSLQREDAQRVVSNETLAAQTFTVAPVREDEDGTF